MALSRRHILAGAAAAAAWQARAAQNREATGPKARTKPSICLYSQVLIQIGYDELGGVLRSLGVDGCDLAVMPGSHIRREHFDLDVERAIEAVTGAGVDVPVLTTDYTSLADDTIRTMAGFASQMGVPLFRAGHWKYTGGEIETRLAEVQRDLAGLAALARAANMTVLIQNVAGQVGGAIWDAQMLIRGMDPRTVGYDFDAGYAVEQGGPGWETAFRLALPRIRMVTARDFYWAKEAGTWKPAACPLGEGMVDWARLFSGLARARFTGPVSVTVDYPAGDPPAAIQRDVAFLRKQVEAAYG